MLTERTTTSVLIIDESREEREVYRRLLTQPGNGYTIMEADSAEEGLQLQRSSQLDCILLDENLPEHQGRRSSCSKSRPIGVRPPARSSC